MNLPLIRVMVESRQCMMVLIDINMQRNSIVVSGSHRYVQDLVGTLQNGVLQVG